MMTKRNMGTAGGALLRRAGSLMAARDSGTTAAGWRRPAFQGWQNDVAPHEPARTDRGWRAPEATAVAFPCRRLAPGTFGLI